ncbi:ATP-binding protein [Natronobiforma cellulositropha]|uniref:ATP-binding protein n=1 Tax=Natronobiforma cellulositropha TaxID=1679076 RepID=UPI0021D58CE7|nr:ATP-binding protein [Natronobiforma cellulositropha]
MSESPEPAGLPESVQYQPLPNIYQAFAAGASPYAIVTETIDNSIDFVRRQALDGAKHPETLEVKIQYEPVSEPDSTNEDAIIENSGSGRLIIVDNAGGVPPTELSRFFQLGHTDAPPEGIGRFGVGAKRLIGIGDRIKYESHATGYEVAAGFEIDARDLKSTDNNEIENDDVYKSDVYRVDDLEEGHTRIIVEDLNENVWSNLLGRGEKGEIDQGADNSLWRLGETYEHFLRNGIHIAAPTITDEGTIDFELRWADSERAVTVNVPDSIRLAWLPFDGLHPRRYEELPFANSAEIELENALRANITVALMPSSNPLDAGLTVTMNNRNVMFRDTDNDLFSTRYLGKFRESQGHGRLHCTIELQGPAENMPWSDTKDSLDGTQEVTNHLLNVTENALGEYRRQTYENLPKWVLAAYSDEALEAFDDEIHEDIPESVEKIDKSKSKINSPRFNKKPGTSASGKYYRAYPERDGVIKCVRLHSELRIRSDAFVPVKSRPAYQRYFEKEHDHDTLTDLSPNECPNLKRFEVPVYADDPNDIPLVDDITELALRHATEERVLTDETEGVPIWLLPRYLEEFEQQGGEPDTATAIDEFDLEDWRAKYSTSEEVRRGPEFSDPESEPRPEWRESTESQPTDQLIELPDETTGSRRAPDEEDESPNVRPRSKAQKPRDQSDRTNFQEGATDTDVQTSEAGAFENEPRSRGTNTEYIEELRTALDMDNDVSMESVVDTVQNLQNERKRLQNEREQLINYLRELDEIVNFTTVFEEPPDLDAFQENESKH